MLAILRLITATNLPGNSKLVSNLANHIIVQPLQGSMTRDPQYPITHQTHNPSLFPCIFSDSATSLTEGIPW